VADLAQEELGVLIGPLALGDVAGDFRGAHDPATRIGNGRNGERDVQQGAVLAAPTVS
jgi:hypothetical protein